MSESTQGSSRRTVLKGAAWTAPAIVLATAAPAVALSGAANITQSASGVLDRPSLTMRTTIAYVNANTGATTATTTVVLRSSAGQIGAGDPTAVSAGWAFVSVTPVGSAGIRTYTFSGVIPGAPSATSTQSSSLAFTVAVETAIGGLVGGSIEASTAVPSPASVTPDEVRGLWGDLPST